MARRKNRTSSTLPPETLERARQQAGVENEEVEDESTPVEEPKTVNTGSGEKKMTAGARSRRRSAAAAAVMSSRTSSRRDRKIEELTMEDIEHLLHNPTKVVTEDELRQQYGYVLRDLRNMGMLAAALFVALIVLALVLL